MVSISVRASEMTFLALSAHSRLGVSGESGDEHAVIVSGLRQHTQHICRIFPYLGNVSWEGDSP
jgi:hypothetical protein